MDAQERMQAVNDKPKDEVHVHIDSSKQHDDVPEFGPDFCPECKVATEQGFGLAGGGYGVYTYCPQCGKILSKTQEFPED